MLLQMTLQLMKKPINSKNNKLHEQFLKLNYNKYLIKER